MATHTRCSSGMLAFALVVFAATASAQSPGGQAPGERQSRAVVSTTKVSPAERGQLTRQFVTKWGNYVQRVYQVPVGTWSKRMVPNFVNADASNFRNALKRDTFEGAMAELTGTGHRLSDAAVITRFASMDVVSSKSRGITEKFGDVNSDLVYTPVQPCRIVDTRNTALGVIAAGGTRNFVGISSDNFTGQGGSTTNCNTLNAGATALALNVTAVGYVLSGHATVYPFGTTRPDTASVNYNAPNYATNNGIIARIPNPISSYDFTIWTAQSSHYVVDVVGYFAPPVATALECVETTAAVIGIAVNDTDDAFAPA